MRAVFFSKNVQIVLLVIATSALVLLLSGPPRQCRIVEGSSIHKINVETIDNSALLYPAQDDLIDYRRCSPLAPLRIFVHHYEHPLAITLASHPAATQKEQDACLFISFVNVKDKPSQPFTWRSVAEPGLNHIIINLNDDASIVPEGREMIIQSNFENGGFRQFTDFSVSTDVLPGNSILPHGFNTTTWKQRPSIMPLKRDDPLTIVGDFYDTFETSPITQVDCAGDCSEYLLTSTFCILPSSSTFNARLLSVLRAGCIPVVISNTQPLPFQDQLDWRLASFRFSPSMLYSVSELLEDVDKEDIMEMRRMGRIFLARFDDAQALAKSLVAAIADRVQLALPLHPEISSRLIAPNGTFKNATYNATRIHSRFGSKKLTALRLYSRARWNSGRDLTYTPQSLHDVPQMPGDAAFYAGTKEHLVAVGGAKRLGLTRDEEQFTVLILTYNRDDGVKKIIERLRDCPHLNKVIVLWNNPERRPNGTWPEIHVPVEFVLSERNSLLSRFIPYDRTETEAVVSIDDDMGVGQPELTFAFRMWRENRDRVVGFPERYHLMKNGKGKYGLSGTCEHSLILTGFAIMHKEFLFEFTYNQHPSILEYIDKNRNCEDIAMNYLVSHLTRKPPLKVVKKINLSNGSSKKGLSARGAHYKERDECIRMFSAIYGYNPLLFTQEVARPNGSCVKGL